MPKAAISKAKETRPPALASIGAMIARLREDRRMTQAELGEKVGTTQSVIARIEKGEQNLSTETLAKLSAALGQEIVQISRGGTVNFRIHGGRKLSGTIQVRTSKNGAVGVMCASLLNRGTTVIKNAPKIEEVSRISEVLESIGAKIEWIGADLRITPPERLDMKSIAYDSAAKTRSVVMMAGSLVHRLERFDLPQASGCTLGSRTIKPYVYALETLGISIETSSRYYHVSHKGLKKGREIVMYEAGDTVTEAVLMAAALIPGKTVIKFASANYQVQDVAFYLELLGAQIDGIGTSTMTVHGLDRSVKKDVEYYLSEDPIEAMSLIAAAIVTGSAITVERAPIDFLELELLKLEKMGFKYKITKRYKADNGKTNLVDIETKPSKLKALDEKIHAQPYPGINMDNLPFFVVIGAVAEGETFIHDWSYEERAIYYKELAKLRAETILADPHRFYIKGPTRFKAAEMVCPPALRPSVIIMIAMLAAEGVSILRNVYNINRGYEDLAERLNALGAKIEVFRDL
ncbi:MAG: UDP-N-acetylglucosamine 1-carboxyvinyltransferase [Candidatus Taylorbacteria bacterium]|nr:UDP-N-acetylglucosamine 1-carboxyvinyltransferase [Candidatus Taylorbacteria bacterium]